MKEDILDILKEGPMLPKDIMRKLGEKGKKIDTILLGAYLSELISTKKVGISKMKIGGSPLYFLPKDMVKLVDFSEHLKEPLKEAFDIIREREILRDDELEPKIRVAMSEIKDFAKKIEIIYEGNSIYLWQWRFVEDVKDRIKSLLEKDSDNKDKKLGDDKDNEDVKEDNGNIEGDREREGSNKDSSNKDDKDNTLKERVVEDKERSDAKENASAREEKSNDIKRKENDGVTSIVGIARIYHKEDNKYREKDNGSEIPILTKLKRAGINVIEYNVINKKHDLKINASVNSDVGKIPMTLIYKNKKITNSDLIEVLEIKNYNFITLLCKDASKSVLNSAKKVGIHILFEKDI